MIVNMVFSFFSILGRRGGKIEVNIRKNMIQKFKAEIEEGKVYKSVYFAVINKSGKFRASSHDYKVAGGINYRKICKAHYFSWFVCLWC